MARPGVQERPELVDVDDGAVELVAKLVKVPHTDFTEIPRMVLVEEDPVVVHASGVTATAGMLAVLADTPVTGADVAPFLAVLLEPRRHRCPPRVFGERLLVKWRSLGARVLFRKNI